MVKQCINNSYPKENIEKYTEHFNHFSFPLSDFQKHSIEGIVEGHHSLVCCPTGSGKTLPAEFAIDYFVSSKGKRLIYTTPLKALSNEKFYDFTKKYPNISFGILTGDIKINPDAQVLIMTAEILLNTLFTKKQVLENPEQTKTNNFSLSFDMDFDTELACVVMDEIHFINDSSRGRVWEETIMMLPHHIQMIMLSATLDSPEKFAQWIEKRPEPSQSALQTVSQLISQKEVYLSISTHRIVPLSHYSFITTNQGFFKQIKKDEVLTKKIKDTINHPLLLQSSNGVFQDETYHKVKQTLELFRQKEVYIKRQHIINEVCMYMFQNNMLPAVLFILSRKQIESVSKEITAVLLEDDSKIPYIVHRECEDILRKLPNYSEYIELPEYVQMVSLLQKGIGIHHSGVIPILREITEILFSKGYIKLLLATETFSVGLNMPIKTTVFTSMSKFDGVENRFFHSHEYMQCSGRAGRRGIDTVGNVIHLNNLFKSIDIQDYKLIMNGKPQKLVSKFKLSYNLILNLIGKSNEREPLSFIKQSMNQEKINAESIILENEIKKTEEILLKHKPGLDILRTPIETIKEYIFLTEHKNTLVNKKRKETERKISNIRDEYRYIDQDTQQMLGFMEKQKTLDNLKKELDKLENYVSTNINIICDMLSREGFLFRGENNILTHKGMVSTQIKELHCLVFANLLNDPIFLHLKTIDMVLLFSCFTNIVVTDELKKWNYNSTACSIHKVLDYVNEEYNKYKDFETAKYIDTGIEYNIHYDLLDYITEWYNAKTSIECKCLLQKIEVEKGIFTGEFIKAILKINTVSNEMEKIAESIGNMDLLSKLKEIPVNTMKYIATNQSLYL